MKHALLVSILILLLPGFAFTQGVSCPAVIAGPDTTLNCNDCVLLHAEPVSGFTTTTYNVQSIPYSPYPFNAGNSILVNIDDVWGTALPIGFNFCFYGNSYNQCVVGSNGVVSFDLSYASGYCAWPITQGIPGNTDVLNSILGPLHDIDPSVGGSIYWSQYGQAPCRVFVCSFYQIPMYSCNNLIATQQIVLYETTNIIEVYIQNKPTCAGWNSGAAIEGIQNANGTQAVVVPGRNFPGTWNATNDAYAFVPAGAQNYTLTWYEVGNPIPLTTLDTITVCPPGPRDYYAEVVYTNCDGATVTVRDTASIVASTSSMVLSTAHTDAACNGSTNGTASITITGNTNPYTILWSSGQTTASISGLAAGIYTVTVTEQGGCAAVASVTVAQPPAIVLQTQSANPICNGSMTGTASVNASGGSAPYAYLWSNGATTPGITNLGVGSYGVTVTDANGCPSSTSVTITQPALLVVNTVGTNITCFGDNDGSATSTVSGGVLPYQYAWSNGSNATSLSNLGPGSYTLTITDANGCIGISSVLIVEPPVFSIQASAVDVSCNGSANGTATVTPTGGAGGYVYLWSHGPTTQNVSGLAPGTYFVTVTDAGGCFRSTSVTITQPTALVLQTQHTDVLCSGQANGTASVTASGATPAYSYAWSNGGNQASVSGLAGGTYTVTVTDANGCTATRAIIVAEPPLLTVSTTGTDITCFAGTNGTATAVGAGGTPPYQYAWSNGAGGATAFGLGSGTYTVTATDGNGCTSTTSITLSEPTQISLTITGDNAVCEYETIDLNSVVTGGVPPYSYQWWSVAPAVNDTNPSLHYYDAHDDRTYFLNIIDQNGCEATASYYVESNPQPTADFIVDRTEICDTGTVLFTNLSTPTPLGSSWEFGDGQTSNGTSPSHLYGSGIWSVTLTVIDDQGCTNSMTQEQLIHVIPTPEASFVSDPNITLVDHLLLSQATITFNNTSSWFASGVDWSFGDGVSAFTGQVTHTYQDTGTYCITINAYNQFGCHDDSMQCITILQDPFLWIPTGFTPNGDGLNDIFFAGGVEIKQFEMWIFDRWGKLIFHSDAMDKGWDGKAMQEDSPEGAYVFKIHAVNNEGFKMDRAGTVTLIR